MLPDCAASIPILFLITEHLSYSSLKYRTYYQLLIVIFPFQATDAYHVFTSGQQKIQQGLLRDGYELISEALNLLNNVYGAMHPEIAACARLLARLNYIMGDYHEVSESKLLTLRDCVFF